MYDIEISGRLEGNKMENCCGSINIGDILFLNVLVPKPVS